jgi:hypothetical protein
MKARHLRPTSRAVRVGRALTVPVVALAALSAAAPAMAARPSGGSSSSGSSLSVVVETGPDQTPNFGETITFKVTSTVYKKWVDVTCYQNGTFVYSATAGFFPEYPWAPDYTLSSAYWTGGAASCDARLYTQSNNGKQSTLAKLTFAVDA